MEEIKLTDPERKGLVVHNYGAGGTGFQVGYGMATDAVLLVEEALQSILSNTESIRPLL